MHFSNQSSSAPQEAISCMDHYRSQWMPGDWEPGQMLPVREAAGPEPQAAPGPLTSRTPQTLKRLTAANQRGSPIPDS
ncbi:hypothetical protein SKAU_G00190400 [Synaphobranchus kaupii]|uniref:Uncharacterized protein n=1 Tax=Synaphobranchus kaupii TaxID=118154 RepID=A0A9Q1IWT8_SYNKA|nr:hypothetical protein SKAU_G00190400 [Synaphobranchus kaupii]